MLESRTRPNNRRSRLLTLFLKSNANKVRILTKRGTWYDITFKQGKPSTVEKDGIRYVVRDAQSVNIGTGPINPVGDRAVKVYFDPGRDNIMFSWKMETDNFVTPQAVHDYYLLSWIS